MKASEKQLKLHKQIIDLLIEYYGHDKFDYIIGAVERNQDRQPSTVMSNMTPKNLMGFLVEAAEKLAKEEGLV